MSEIRKFIDLTGKRYGFLVILGRDVEKNPKRTYWKCVCDCGEKTSVRGDALSSGRTISCGCYHKNIASKKTTNKKYNKYKVHGDITKIYTFSGDIILIDTEDFDKVRGYCWSIASTGYAQSREYENDSIVLIHRIIMNPTANEVVDHKYHNLTDNRKKNLRLCNQSNNMANQKLSKRNTTGIKGVYWSKEKNKWNAKIGFQNKSVDLGYYDKKEDAAQARLEAELKYFGKYRYIEE